MKRLILFKIFVFFFITLFCILGTWQLYRLQWKQDLINQISVGLNSSPIQFSEKNNKNYQRVFLIGKYDFNNQIYLYSLNEKGQPGFDVITPFETLKKENILINRGWIKKELKKISSTPYQSFLVDRYHSRHKISFHPYHTWRNLPLLWQCFHQ